MARSFNGISDLITTNTVNSGGGNYTFSVWGYTSLANSYNAIIGLGGNTLKLYVKSTGKTAAYSSGPGLWDPSTGPTISANAWFNFVVTVATGGVVNSYINGVSDASGTNALVASFNTNCTYGSDASGNWWSGILADGALWNVVLGAAEILALSKGARPTSIRPPTALLFWNPLTGLQSPEPDLSGNLHSGTLTGTVPAFGPPIMAFTPRWPQALMMPPVSPFTLMPQIVT